MDICKIPFNNGIVQEIRIDQALKGFSILVLILDD